MSSVADFVKVIRWNAAQLTSTVNMDLDLTRVEDDVGFEQASIQRVLVIVQKMYTREAP